MSKVNEEGTADIPSIIPSQTPAEIWKKLVTQVEEWYFRPDLEALKIILAAEASYQLSDSEQLWIHLIGPSSSGKTSLGIALLDGLYPDHHMLGEITPNTFLSGLTRGREKGKMNSFLHQIGEKGLIYAPDFTNFLASNPEIVAKVAGQFREIYDGSANRRAGSMEKANSWKGSVAVVTAFTPSKEHAWHAHNREGERFLTLRWPGTSPRGEEERKAFGRILKSTGDKKVRQEALRDIVRELIEAGRAVDATGHGMEFPDTHKIEDTSYSLAELVGLLRTLPVRPDGRVISHVAAIEGAGRSFKQLIKAAAGWAALMRKPEVDLEDWKLAERLAIDTIPEPRRWILEALPWDGGCSSVDLLLEMTPFENKSAVEWHVADLVALKVVGMNRVGEVTLRREFVELAERGCGDWVRGLREGFEEKLEGAEERAIQSEFALVT